MGVFFFFFFLLFFTFIKVVFKREFLMRNLLVNTVAILYMILSAQTLNGNQRLSISRIIYYLARCCIQMRVQLVVSQHIKQKKYCFGFVENYCLAHYICIKVKVAESPFKLLALRHKQCAHLFSDIKDKSVYIYFLTCYHETIWA